MRTDKLKCPIKLPRGFKQFLLEEIQKNDQVMVFERGGKVATCNHCRHEVHAEELDPYYIMNEVYRNRPKSTTTARFRTEQSVICPHCGTRVKNVLRMGALRESWFLTNAICIQRGEGADVWLREFDVYRNDANVYRTEADLDMREVFRWKINGKDVRKYVYDDGCYYGLRGWVWTASTWKFPDEYVFYAPEFSKAMLQGTSLQYADPESGWCFRGNDDTGRYLVDFPRFAAVEKLYKAGFVTLIDQKSAGIDSQYGMKGTINWNAKTVYKALRLPQWMVKVEEPVSWTYDKVNRAKQCCRLYKEGKVSKEKAVELYKANLPLGYLSELCEYAPIEGVINYLNKNKGNSAYLWRDYLDQAALLGWDLKKKDNLYPKNLKEAHDKVGRLVKMKKNEAKDLRIREKAAMLEDLCFQDGEYLIRPARCYEDFVKESDGLNHCVGRSTVYMDGMIKGERGIFFIRKVSEPDKPFFTLDYFLKKHHLEQCRTKNNSPYTTNISVMNFMAKWFKEIVKDKSTYKLLVAEGAAA